MTVGGKAHTPSQNVNGTQRNGIHLREPRAPGHTHPCGRRGRSAGSPLGGCSPGASGLSLPPEAAKAFFPTTLFLKMQFFHSSENKTERVITYLWNKIRRRVEWKQLIFLKWERNVLFLNTVLLCSCPFCYASSDFLFLSPVVGWAADDLFYPLN